MTHVDNRRIDVKHVKVLVSLDHWPHFGDVNIWGRPTKAGWITSGVARVASLLHWMRRLTTQTCPRRGFSSGSGIPRVPSRFTLRMSNVPTKRVTKSRDIRHINLEIWPTEQWDETLINVSLWRLQLESYRISSSPKEAVAGEAAEEAAAAVPLARTGVAGWGWNGEGQDLKISEDRAPIKCPWP